MADFIETSADVEIRKCLEALQSFSVIAGAGSGKTRSLVQALNYLKDSSAAKLRRDGQKIVCITYTNRAVEVISSRVDWDDLFLISTLHSFLWNEVKKFTPNIKEALREHVIPAQIKKKRADDNGGMSKKAIAARARVESLEADLDCLEGVQDFQYEEANFSIYSEGKLNHDDVIDVAAYLIRENEILRNIIGQKYPYIFVDEAQDTFMDVVEALNVLCGNEGLPIVGYFGDPMQQIYDKRAGNFGGPEGSALITKEENYRCSRQVIRLLNAFRKDVQQVPGGDNADIEGTVSISLIQAEAPEGERRKYSEKQIGRVSKKFDEALVAWGWSERPNVKRLFLVRQMIARRLGFTRLQALFTGNYASTRAQEDYEKGDHFLLKPFVACLCPLFQAHRAKDLRTALDVLRKSSPAFDPQGVNSEKSLSEMTGLSNNLMQELSALWEGGTLGDILRFGSENLLFRLSERLSLHLERDPREEKYDAELHLDEKGDWLADAFFQMKTDEIEALVDFVSENTPLSTQHGVKGEEYTDVLVVFDDVEAAWNNYSFTKTLTPDTSGDPSDGQKDRSTKLAYVCFSRAEENLRILLFTPDPEAAKKEFLVKGLFDESQILIAA